MTSHLVIVIMMFPVKTCASYIKKTAGSTTLKQSQTSYLILDGVGGVLLLLALLVWPADIQILHVSCQHLGHTDA